MNLLALLTIVLSPSFYMVTSEGTKDTEWSNNDDQSSKVAVIDEVQCRLNETTFRGEKAYEISLTNIGNEVFKPIKAGIRLGIDTWMDTYPQWLEKWVPTFLDCQADNFSGYMQTPKGQILGLFSPDPIASWSLDYNLGYPDPFWFYGHRISSVNLDIINMLPLPDHHPKQMWKLEPGETITVTLIVKGLDSLDSFDKEKVRLTDAPSIIMEKTAFSSGQVVKFDVAGRNSRVKVISPSGKIVRASETVREGNISTYTLRSKEEGEFHITAYSESGKTATGVITVLRPWEYTIRSARRAAIDCPQKPTSHVESWYGFNSAFIAASVFPSETEDRFLDERFDYIMNLIYDDNCVPYHYGSRIQNTSCTIGMYIDRFQTYSRLEDLEKAATMADWLIDYSQAEDGAYMNGHTKYTSVIYVAKSILELSIAEMEYGISSGDPAWKEASNRHFNSAKWAIDQLVNADGDFQTEGEMTFEDGMISCSALQIGMLAMMYPGGSAERELYKNAMLKLLASHDCLTCLKAPDGRRRGGTIRFWEAQYDVMMLPNMITTPHGWSGWRAYATFYAYLLTGDERWITESWNAAGSFAALVDGPEKKKEDTGKVRWAFVADPFVLARQVDECAPGSSPDSVSFGNPHPDLYKTKELIVGEQYIDMISSWQGINTQDNDVHEVFRFIGESFLTNAFVIEKEDGSLSCYNCTAEFKKGYLDVTPDEDCITRLHLNLQTDKKVRFQSKVKTTTAGISWFDGNDIDIFNCQSASSSY